MHRNVRQVTRVIKNLGVLVFLHQEDTIYLNSSGQTIANRHLRPDRELANGLLDFSSNSWEATVANSTYNALQTSLEKKVGDLRLLAAYTWSKSIDNSSSFFDAINPFNPRKQPGAFHLRYFDSDHRGHLWAPDPGNGHRVGGPAGFENNSAPIRTRDAPSAKGLRREKRGSA